MPPVVNGMLAKGVNFVQGLAGDVNRIHDYSPYLESSMLDSTSEQSMKSLFKL